MSPVDPIASRTIRSSDTTSALSTSDRVVLKLREMLLAGGFQPGERLLELDLVRRLKASRTPVRHALNQLAHEGLLEAVDSGGFRARAFPIEDVWDAIELRGVLEGTAARLAAERLSTPQELASLREHLEAMEALLPLDIKRYPRFLELNEKFHRALWALAKSPVLTNALEGVMRLPFAAPSAHVPLEAHARVRTADMGQEHHRTIVDAIAARQGTRAEAVAREHSHVARLVIESTLKDAELTGRMPGGRLITFSPEGRRHA